MSDNKLQICARIINQINEALIAQDKVHPDKEEEDRELKNLLRCVRSIQLYEPVTHFSGKYANAADAMKVTLKELEQRLDELNEPISNTRVLDFIGYDEALRRHMRVLEQLHTRNG